MAISFRGSIASPVVIGNDATLQNLFTITNKVGSRVNIIIRKAQFSVDSLTALATVAPVIKVSRATAISGGAILSPSTYSTLQSSNASVEIRTAIANDQPITATAGTTLWTKYAGRAHTVVEQMIPYGIDALPDLVKNEDFILRAGESLLFRVVGATTASNPALSTNWFVKFVWEEDEIATFGISGTVTLSGSPVAGARVIVIESDDILMTNPVLREVIITPAGGTWASTIKTGKIGSAFVQYENGGTYYTANGSPFLS